MEANVDVKALWDQVVDDVKQKVIHTTLWRSLEMVTPLLIEDNIFVVGLEAGNFHLSGNLLSSEHKNAIDTALRRFSGLPLTMRLIEGTTVSDWQNAKLKDRHAHDIREADIKKKEDQAAITRSWEGLWESASRRYATTALRQLPQYRAQYIADMLEEMCETLEILMPKGKPTNEIAERSLARVIDKIGQLTETPPALIALELRRLRGD